MAMSNLPSMRLVSWNTELGVGVTLTSRPFFAKKPLSCATQIGQLKPPGKTMRLTVFGVAGGAVVQAARSSIARILKSVRMSSPPEYDINVRRKCHERLERYPKPEPRRDDEARRALQRPQGLGWRFAGQPAARVPAQALRGDRLSASDARHPGRHFPGGRRRLGDAGDRHCRGLQPWLLTGEAGQGPVDAQPRHQRNLHRHDRALALRMERR